MPVSIQDSVMIQIGYIIICIIHMDHPIRQIARLTTQSSRTSDHVRHTQFAYLIRKRWCPSPSYTPALMTEMT